MGVSRYFKTKIKTKSVTRHCDTSVFGFIHTRTPPAHTNSDNKNAINANQEAKAHSNIQLVSILAQTSHIII